MNKLDYRKVGVAALIAYALGNLLNLLPPSFLGSYGYITILFLISFIGATIFTETWAILYWKASRTRLSLAVLVIINIILLSSLISLWPVFELIFSVRELPSGKIIAFIFIGVFIMLCIIGMIRGAKNVNSRNNGSGGGDGGASVGGYGDGGGGDGGGGDGGG